MTATHRALRLLSLALRAAAGGVAVSTLARARSTVPPIRPTLTPLQSISVVVPARDEATRIVPLLDAVVGAPGVAEVIVVDDRSTDSTAAVADRAGATVIEGAPLPPGWAGKAWAIDQGVAAASGDWVVTLDADTRPSPQLPQALVARAVADRADLVTVAGRFDCPTPAGRWLHAAMLTTLVYRFGPPGSTPTTPRRAMANGQCMAFGRRWFDSVGRMSCVRDHVVEDVALARRLAADGWTVEFLDASEILEVRMFESFSDTWRGWGRSLALPGVEGRWRRLADLAVVVLTQTLPLPRLVSGRGDGLDLLLLANRLGTLVGTRRAYATVDLAYWASPLADPLAVIAIALGVARRRQSWRGRTYD